MDDVDPKSTIIFYRFTLIELSLFMVMTTMIICILVVVREIQDSRIFIYPEGNCCATVAIQKVVK